MTGGNPKESIGVLPVPACPLLDRNPHRVPPLLVLAAKLGDEGVLDGLGAFVRLEVALGHVCGVFTSVDEDVIPRQVFRRTGACHGVVPLVSTLKCRIDIEDHASIVEFLVVDDLTDKELGRVLHLRSAYQSWACGVVLGTSDRDDWADLVSTGPVSRGPHHHRG